MCHASISSAVFLYIALERDTNGYKFLEDYGVLLWTKGYSDAEYLHNFLKTGQVI